MNCGFVWRAIFFPTKKDKVLHRLFPAVLRALVLGLGSQTDQPELGQTPLPGKDRPVDISHSHRPSHCMGMELRTQHAALHALALCHSEDQIRLLIKIVVTTNHPLCHARDDAGRTSSFRTTWTKGVFRYQEQRHGQLRKFVRSPWSHSKGKVDVSGSN